MAMLAEPKRKQRWCINPNGRTWTDDDSKIGQKMLEKMGWTKGSGLGKSQAGMTDPIKVKGNSNQTGLGFAGVCDTVWVQHQDDFNSLLSKLSQSVEAEAPAKEAQDEPKSLEVMSKASSKRIHYHKFARSKDLKKASAQDLASIFGVLPGSKRNSSANSDAEDSNDAPTTEDSSTEEKPHNFGVATIHGGCLNEYFSRKRAAKSAVACPTAPAEMCDVTVVPKTEDSLENVQKVPSKKMKRDKVAEQVLKTEEKVKEEIVLEGIEEILPVKAGTSAAEVEEAPAKRSKKKRKKNKEAKDNEPGSSEDRDVTVEVQAGVEEVGSKKTRQNEAGSEEAQDDTAQPCKKKRMKRNTKSSDDVKERSKNRAEFKDGFSDLKDQVGQFRKLVEQEALANAEKTTKSETSQTPTQPDFSVAPLLRRSAQQIVAHQLISKSKVKKTLEEKQSRLDVTGIHFPGANANEIPGYPPKKKKKIARVKQEAV